MEGREEGRERGLEGGREGERNYVTVSVNSPPPPSPHPHPHTPQNLSPLPTFPVSISYSNIPQLHQSAEKPYGSPRNTSGAMYWGVPAIVVVFSETSSILALPKSVRTMCPNSESMQFSGFRSLCYVYVLCVLCVCSHDFTYNVTWPNMTIT